MRYLGNKETIIPIIHNLLEKHNLLERRLIFLDAFCGTGTVSNSLKDYYDIIINDNLLMATVFTTGRIVKQTCTFDKLGFDPIDFFNSNTNTFEGFFSKNYAPKKSLRMYFSDFNAGRIDYFRETIEKWKLDNLLNKYEYEYLLACLLESVSKVANIAGVYGAFLKKWDPRAKKDIVFLNVESFESKKNPNILKVYNENLCDIIDKVCCDILYLDPPYTKNKYSTQYHLLETLVKNDNPNIKGITGARPFVNMSNAWSKPYDVEVEFTNTIKQCKAKYILMSYSSDGLMSKEFILNVLKRYGYAETLDFIEIPYKKYRNSKTTSTNKHYEYLFFVEKKPKELINYYCPLNYMGGKSNIIEYIKPHLTGKTELIDMMSGGFNVGINGVNFQHYIYNDINHFVKELIMMFKVQDTIKLLKSIDEIISKYNLKKNDKESYLEFRNDYNNKIRFKNDYVIYLYVLILYGFQQQIRFNSNYEFNNPIGESGYNESIKEKVISFSLRLKELNVSFNTLDYTGLKQLITKESLVYIDPPYLITLGSYNDGKRGFNGWNEEEEIRLINFIESIKNTGCKIVISNILDYKGKSNLHLKRWIKSNNPTVYDITVRGRQEVLIIYETKILD